ncbi:hypothetical protein ACFVFQ_34015 [Streptomyces sp. NPDC057743]|uniref:hypothetical protein n=1 Tax=Streptomyces sp. NPDC057743 TaxID=3346236 RepID=UPI003684425B
MPKPVRPRELPARLLTNPEMINACRVRDFSRVFRLMKRYAGVYPSMIARLCDLTPSRVAEVVAGQRRLRHMDVIERVADGLRIPGHMVGLARRTWETSAPLEAAEREPDPQAAELERASTAVLPSPEVDSILALTSGAPPSRSTLHALRSSIEDYWRRDDQHGGAALRPAVVGQLRYVEGLLRSNLPNSAKHELYGVAAELAHLTGWLHFDARQYSQGRAYFTQSLELAKEIDDRRFMANVLACMSLQATYQHKPGDALALVNAAQDAACTAKSGVTPRVLSMLSMREAFAHATVGSRTATHAAISEAHRQFERIDTSDPDPAWVTYFDEPKLLVDTGIAHGRLGEAATAEPLIAAAMRRESSANRRGRAFHGFWLARTQLNLGKLEQACHSATGALECTSAVASERLASHLKEFHGQLAAYRQKPAVVAFEARLREVLSN